MTVKVKSVGPNCQLSVHNYRNDAQSDGYFWYPNLALMDRSQILIKLEGLNKSLQNSLQNIQNLLPQESDSLEIAVIEKRLVSFYEDLQAHKMAAPSRSFIAVKDQTPTKSTVAVEDDQPLKSIDPVPVKPEPTAVVPMEVPEEMESESWIDEKTDVELNELMDVAEKEFSALETQVSEEEQAIVSSPDVPPQVQEAPAPNPPEPAIEPVASKALEPSAENQKQNVPVQIEEPTPIAKETPNPEPEIEKKATSINQRHSTDSAPTSLHEKLASRRDPSNQVSAQFKGKPIKDLKKAINLNLQIRFTRELFEGDKRAFKRSIDFLNKCNTFSEARSYLQVEGVNKYEWDENGRHYQDLLGIVKRKFI